MSLLTFLCGLELLEIHLWEVELAQKTGCLFSACFIGLLGKPQQTIEASVVLLYVLCFILGSEGSLRL